MEKDDEVSGSGNSYTAEFWQYDSRLGRRWNLDPKPNPSISNYATFANNPIMYTDVKGDTVEYNSFRDRVKVGVSSILSKDFRADLKELKKSDETFVFNGSKSGEGGHFSTDGDKLYINYTFNSTDSDLGSGRATSLFHETEHGIQFEHGEIGFINRGGGWSTLGLDITDELGAMHAQTKAPGSRKYNIDGTKTFTGHLNDLTGTYNESTPNTTIQTDRTLLLNFYRSQPTLNYHTIPSRVINSTSSNKVKNSSIFIKPYTLRGR